MSMFPDQSFLCPLYLLQPVGGAKESAEVPMELPAGSGHYSPYVHHTEVLVCPRRRNSVNSDNELRVVTNVITYGWNIFRLENVDAQKQQTLFFWDINTIICQNHIYDVIQS